MSAGTLEERFWAKVEKGDSCWLWTGAVTSHGYGHLRRGGRALGFVHAHRAAYALLVGAIPGGLDLDHLCRNRRCANPDHLEPVTRAVNLARGDHNHRGKTHCIRGHEFTPANTRIVGNGRRNCRACQRIGYRRAA